MKLYELNYLISPDLSEEELKIFQEKINSNIQNEGGKLEKIKLPIRKKLAYLIKKKGGAYLVTSDFYFLPEKLENLEKKLKAESNILRYLILTKEVLKKIEIPQIVPEAKVPKVKKEKKVELEKIDEKLKEILGE
jgi:small subunit ribosomal protein S6